MTETAHPIDIYVGKRIRDRRKYLRLTQRSLGEELGVTFQQIQKYEQGKNRVSSSSLYKLARLLDVAIGYFFEDIGGKPCGCANGKKFDAYQRQETRDIVSAHQRIADPADRDKLMQLIRVLGG